MIPKYWLPEQVEQAGRREHLGEYRTPAASYTGSGSSMRGGQATSWPSVRTLTGPVPTTALRVIWHLPVTVVLSRRTGVPRGWFSSAGKECLKAKLVKTSLERVWVWSVEETEKDQSRRRRR